jgi:hypothetical protein
MREERTSGPAQPTTATRVESAAVEAGEVAATTVASSERLSGRRPTVLESLPVDLKMIDGSSKTSCIVAFYSRV